MSHTSTPLKFLVTIVLLEISFAINFPIFNGYQINDLPSTTSSLFDFQASQWTCSGLTTSTSTYTCGSAPVLGGVGILSSSAILSRTYSSLPTHNAVYFEIYFALMDNLKSTDKFILKFDTTTIFTANNLATYKSSFTSNLCGLSSYKDSNTFVVMGSAPHSSSSLSLQLTTNIATAADAGALGIRDISISFVTDSSVTSPSTCFRVFDNSLTYLSGECSCTKGQYKAVLGLLCLSCDASCEDCFGAGSSSECFSCSPGYSLIGSTCQKCHSSCNTCSGTSQTQCVTCQAGNWLQRNNTCTSTCNLPADYSQVLDNFKVCQTNCTASQFMSYNGSCISTCPAPLVQSTIDSNYFCKKPCADGYFWNWNNTCQASCPSPLVQGLVNGDILTCNQPCSTAGDFLYWNNTCYSACPSPLVQSTVNSVKMCSKPCATAGDFFYWNSTCQAGCSSPLIQAVTNDVSVCKKPCSNAGDFYNLNDLTCQGTCLSPLVQGFIYIDVNTCSQPCSPTSEFFYWNNTCKSACDSPLIQATLNNVNICKKPCPTAGDFYYWETSTCQATCPSPLVQGTGDFDTCSQPCSTTSDFFYWNNTCKSACASPLIQATLNNVNVCKKPCSVSGDFYFWENNTCQSTCPSPLLSGTGDFDTCSQPCSTTSDFFYWNSTCKSTCPSPLIQATLNNVNVCKKPCTSPSDFYYSHNNTCLTTCPSPFIQTTYNDVAFCQKPCTIPSDFYYSHNNTCLTTCPSPFIQSTYNNINFCTHPCSSNPTDFLYWDNSCQSDCQWPLTQSLQNSVHICSKPCSNPSDFYFYNNTCLTTCPSPFTSTTQSTIPLCMPSCTPSSYFFYPNGSCYATCPSPLVQQTTSSSNLCLNPCDSGEFLYKNGSCLASCRSPYLQYTEGTIDFCIPPCSQSSLYYYPDDKTCQATCDSPQTSSLYDSTIKICSSSSAELTQEDIDTVNQANSAIDTTGTIAGAGIMAGSIANSGSSHALTTAALVKMLEYIKYMEINYPPRLQLMFDRQSSSSISLNVNFGLPKDAVEEFPKYPLPGRFARYEETSSFILNYWRGLVTLALLLFIIGMATILAPLTKGLKYVHLVFYHIENITKWDLFLLLLCTNIDGIGVYSSLELRNFHPHVGLSLLGAFVCITMNLLIVGLLAQALYMFIDLQRSRNNRVMPLPQISPTNSEFKKEVQKPTDPKKQKWSRYSILYRGFKDISFWQQSFMLFFLLRIYLFDMIIGYFFAYPLAQAILINIMSFALISYLAIKRPYKRPFDLVKLIINESIIALVNINVLILAILDKCEAELTDTRARLGDIVIIANVMFNVLAVAFIVAEVITRVITVYQIMKKSKAKGRAFWMKAFLSLFEQDGLELKSKKKPHDESHFKIRKATTRTKITPHPSFIESASASIMIPKDVDSDLEPLPNFKKFNVRANGKLEQLNTRKESFQIYKTSSTNFLSPTANSSSPQISQSGNTQISDRAQKRSSFGVDTMNSVSEKQRSSIIDLKGLISENYRGLLEENVENNKVKRNLARSGELGIPRSLSIVYRKNETMKKLKGNYAGTIYDDV